MGVRFGRKDAKCFWFLLAVRNSYEKKRDRVVLSSGECNAAL